jgi:hypothetical protein
MVAKAVGVAEEAKEEQGAKDWTVNPVLTAATEEPVEMEAMEEAPAMVATGDTCISTTLTIRAKAVPL